MKNFWFRICFEKEFTSEEEANEYLDETLSELNEYPDVKDLHGECEERAK